MREQLRLKLFGNPEIRRDGSLVIGFRSAKAQALLCYLAVTGKAHTRPALAGLLWSDMPESNARINLSQTLTNLRQLVGPYLTITRQTIAFNRESNYRLDVEEFQAKANASGPGSTIERQQQAVELYQGDFLEGFYVSDAPLFEEWALREQTRLRELAVQTLHKLSIHFTQHGDKGRTKAIDYTTRLLALEPWWEEAHRQLMLLRAQEGQRSAALAQYEICRQILADELGVEPAAETMALYEQIRDDRFDELRAGRSISADYRLEDSPTAFMIKDVASDLDRPVFVTRERELAQLDQFLKKGLAGQGQVAFIIGEAGSGKTALAQEFARQAQQKYGNLIVAGGDCNAHTGPGDPYLPYRAILAMLTGHIESDWTARVISREHASRLENLLPAAVQVLVDVAPDLIDTFVSGSALLSRAGAVAAGNEGGWLTPLMALLDQRKAARRTDIVRQEQLFGQWAKFLQILARRQPLLLLIDDLQWADSRSIDLLFHLGRASTGSRVLIVGIYRPTDVALGHPSSDANKKQRHPLEAVVNEFKRNFGAIQIDLQQTGDRRFVDALLDTEPNRLREAFREALYQHTQGHALFTIEILRGMRERGDLIQDEQGRWIEGAALDWNRLPARIEGIIAERIGRLPVQFREALKIASVEGEVFTGQVIARTQEVAEPKLIRRLSTSLGRQHQLVRSYGTLRLASTSQLISQYRFQHILFQKYLYEQLDEAERVYLHQAVGETLEQLYGDQAEEIAVALARHFEQAAMVSKAVAYLHQAGERAVRLSANEEAVGHFTRALRLLETLPETTERDQQELALQVALGKQLPISRGWGTPELEQISARARELGRKLGDADQSFSVLWGQWVTYASRGSFEMALKVGEELLALGQRQQDSAVILGAHNTLAETLIHLGDYARARAHLEQSKSIYDPQWGRSFQYLYAVEAGLHYLNEMARALWLLGYPDQALERVRESRKLAEKLSGPFNLVYAMSYLAYIHHFRGEAQESQRWVEAAIALCKENGFDFYLAGANCIRGWAVAEQGQVQEGIAEIRGGLAAMQEMGTRPAWSWFLALLIELDVRIGRIEEGLNLVNDAFDQVNERGNRLWESELYRLKGELLLKQAADPAEMESHFRQAIKIAQGQQAKSLELRATVSLARLWQKQGKQEEARQMLAEIYGWFTEGFDTVDLKQAKELLANLSE